MYVCPNCGGNLRFDIPSQNLACDHCDSQFDPYAVEKESDVTEQSFFDANVFVCPQCGGEIMSTENSVAEFCPYCGSSSILSPKLTKAKRPDYIIPFQITKEQCKKNYDRFLSKSLFAPNEYRKAGKIDSFRGIYIPYLSYNVSQNATLNLKGEDNYRQGNYRITDHYQLTGGLDSYYNGISYDASSNFYDDLSSTIAPFNVKEKKEFATSFLSGFYADTGDVDTDLYEPEAFNFANEATMEQLEDVKEFNDHCSIDWPDSDNEANHTFGTSLKSTDSAMYPVWFMSYRNKDRIAYAVVNGQTGKTTADLPVSMGKYLLGSLILAVPFFALIYFVFPALVPLVALTLACLLSVIMSLIYNGEINTILSKDTHANDKGYISKYGDRRKLKKKPKYQSPKSSSITGKVFGTLIAIGFVAFLFFVLGDEIMDIMGEAAGLVILAFTVVSVPIMVYSLKRYTKLPGKKGVPVTIFNLVGNVIAMIIAFIRPVSDIPYYVAVLLVLAIVIFTVFVIIERYNVLATRRLPQFDKKGGDDRA